MQPTTRYAKSEDVHVAYQLFGDGPKNLVFVPGFISHIENYWDEPRCARWLDRLATFARVVIFDKRGTGLSDRAGNLPSMDQRMDDVRAVMDAAGIQEAIVFGISEGGSLASLFAAHHPERCQSLILYGAFAKFKSWFPTDEALEALFQYIDTAWGSGESLPMFAPSMVGDAAFQQWWGKFESLGANPGAATEIMRMNSEIDITDVLPIIQVPTLVLHRTEDVNVDVTGGRMLAELIPNARLLEYPGTDHILFVGENADQIASDIETFVTGSTPAPRLDRVLATVLFTDIVGSTAKAEAMGDQAWNDLISVHDKIVRQEIARFRGREIKSLGDGFLTTFDGPARAIQCAQAVCRGVAQIGLDVRIGVHTGEVEIADDDVRGIAVNIASRISELGNEADVLVSRTVKDLVAGSGIKFSSFGTHKLKGVPDERTVYKSEV
ncbi:adenylate/guanylate cyclase domain-containing protein [Ruegeria sp. A3M17]|uniref:adenylate/guanylate cyclase domain-containing protein n=1 Tax=Ruegeria sp. A3M17 TaxID=2267229 RepID=UPI000DE8AC17|nr:adenylate/guanylate cyclase domain-containing protein [Ruegeria sp. A3M17]RBW63334.1 adenylate/guanylate cyclase domain-containing protein [Ruegeria sp. A3M17]